MDLHFNLGAYDRAQERVDAGLLVAGEAQLPAQQVQSSALLVLRGPVVADLDIEGLHLEGTLLHWIHVQSSDLSHSSKVSCVPRSLAQYMVYLGRMGGPLVLTWLPVFHPPTQRARSSLLHMLFYSLHKIESPTVSKP